jgi:hypothetical protein
MAAMTLLINETQTELTKGAFGEKRVFTRA